MTLIAHAIAPKPPATLTGAGLRGRPLAWFEAGGLGLWSTELDAAVKLERADAFEHHRLVERICAAQPCLPVRFGTAFPTAEAARASLEARSGQLRAALDRVAGKRELALTLLWSKSGGAAPRPPSIPDGAGPGRRYLEERRARYVASEGRKARAAELVERVVGELSVEQALVWHQTCTSADVAVSLAVLVPSERAAERKADLERIAAGFGDVVAVVNGPWPPYTFAGIEEAGGSAPRPTG